MDKKPLIGVSICAMVLLVLGSLSNVVGYQSVKSTTVNDSPLFSIRTNKAITNENIRAITTNYLGKGANSPLMISKRNDTYEKVRDVIVRIQLMDEDTFKILVNTIIYKFSQQVKTGDVDLQKILYAVYQIHSSPKTSLGKGEYHDGNWTLQPRPTLCWFPGCLVVYTTFLLLDIIGVFMLIVLFIIDPTTSISCHPEECTILQIHIHN